MSARPKPSRLRSRTARLALAGAAGLATMTALAPAASALEDTEPLAPEVEPVPAGPEATPEPESQPELATPTAGQEDEVEHGDETAAPAPALAPNFGFQKYRVGVRLADGSYVPEGTSTAGTEFTITETSQDGSTYTFTCTTSAETTSEDGATFCLEDEADYPESPEEPSSELADGPVARAVVEPGVAIDPEDTGDDDGQLFVLQPGTSVSVALSAAPPNLRGVAQPAAVDACIAPDLGAFCVNSTGDDQVSAVTFSLVGLPPVATDDAARTTVNVPVDIAILPNDDTVLGAPLTGLVLASAPTHGTATLVGTTARYTPASGFTGTDAFTYTISTPNGTATATVHVVVVGGAIVSSSTVLPNTGGPQAALLGSAALLLGGGAWALTRGRREALGADVTL